MIRGNVLNIKQRIPREITIVVVSKGRAVEQISEAIEAGMTDVGENRIQEAIVKYDILTGKRANGQTGKQIKWHMVGHLQTNKVRDAVRIFDLIQSVDTLQLAVEINKQAARINKVQDILLEIKTSPEATKFGLKPEEAIEAAKEISELKNINLKGLMTIAPLVANPQEARPYFRRLKELLNEIKVMNKNRNINVLSMGMSDDYEVAIEEGATMVRLGRAIFE